MKLRATPTRFAIWDNVAVGDAPWDSPDAHMAHIREHSDIKKVADAAPVFTGTLNLNQTATGGVSTPRHVETHIMFAHNLPYLPMVWGRIYDGTLWIPFRGSVPILMVQGSTQGNDGFGLGFARWLTLGADVTNVYIHEMSPIPAGIYWNAAAFPVELHATDMAL